MTIHVYRASDQKATRYRETFGDKTFIVTNPPRRCFPCKKCKRMRYARNLVVHVYYDGTYYFCAPGKGCKATHNAG